MCLQYLSELCQHSGIATSIRLQKHTDILTVYKEYGMIMEEPLVNETDIS